MSAEGLRSPREKVGGLYRLARTLNKFSLTTNESIHKVHCLKFRAAIAEPAKELSGLHVSLALLRVCPCSRCPRAGARRHPHTSIPRRTSASRAGRPRG